MRHCVKIYSSNGASVLTHAKQAEISSRLESGEIVEYLTPSGNIQYRLASSQTRYQKPAPTSPASITYMESKAYSGELGQQAQHRAQEKIDAWPDIYDDRAVVVCAGIVRRPLS